VNAAYWVRRGLNGVRKVAAALTPFSESVWPGVRNNLFVAHESIYGFFGRHVADRRVLDAGCGTGYGANRLRRMGALSVLGVDLDARSIRYARRHYQLPGLTFEAGDCEKLALPGSSLDLVVSSNMIEHLEKPERFLGALRATLAPGGRAILAMPPITTAEALEENSAIHYHRSNQTVDGWIGHFEAAGWRWELVAHRFRKAAPRLDFASPFPSKLSEEDFVFDPSSRDDVYARTPYTAVFVLR
jgi:SAM-dependent methyltransferase